MRPIYPPKIQKEIEERERRIRERLSKIKYKIAIMSGKGGVGKTTFAVNFSYALALKGYKVGILDADIYGPDVPIAMGLLGKHPEVSMNEILPVQGPLGIKVMSIQFFLDREDEPLIWMGPLVVKAIQQLISDVRWGELDFLVVDLPPGTGDEVLGIVKTFDKIDGIIIVVTPQRIAIHDASKAVRMSKVVGVKVLGIVENMSGFICPHCGKVTYIFGRGGGKEAAEKLEVPFLGELPLDIRIRELTDKGIPFIATEEAKDVKDKFLKIVEKVIEGLNANK